jgi:hypothetical protein
MIERNLMLHTYLGDEKSECNIINSKEYKITSLVETSFILLVYAATVLWAVITVGKSLGVQGYITISIFFATELTSLIIYIINFSND